MGGGGVDRAEDLDRAWLVDVEHPAAVPLGDDRVAVGQEAEPDGPRARWRSCRPPGRSGGRDGSREGLRDRASEGDDDSPEGSEDVGCRRGGDQAVRGRVVVGVLEQPPSCQRGEDDQRGPAVHVRHPVQEVDQQLVHPVRLLHLDEAAAAQLDVGRAPRPGRLRSSCPAPRQDVERRGHELGRDLDAAERDPGVPEVQGRGSTSRPGW